MADASKYFAHDVEAQSTGKGNLVQWDGQDPIEIVPGLGFQPVLGDRMMVNFVRFDPETEAPLHWHEEEQITFVLEGELELEVGGDKHILRRGQAVVIPPNVPHGARTREGSCLEVDVFDPPRKALLDAMEEAGS